MGPEMRLAFLICAVSRGTGPAAFMWRILAITPFAKGCPLRLQRGRKARPSLRELTFLSPPGQPATGHCSINGYSTALRCRAKPTRRFRLVPLGGLIVERTP